MRSINDDFSEHPKIVLLLCEGGAFDACFFFFSLRPDADGKNAPLRWNEAT